MKPVDYKRLLGKAQAEWGVKLVEKADSKLMRAIGWFLRVTRINTDFMEGYITTLHRTIYWPDLGNTDFSNPRDFETLNHELCHVGQYKRYWLFYDIGWLLWFCLAPLALFSLLAIWFSIYHLFWLVFLLTIIPIPWTVRACFESQAYGVGYRLRMIYAPSTVTRDITWTAEHSFATSSYYWMATAEWAKERLKGYLVEPPEYAFMSLAEEVVRDAVEA